MAKLFQYFIFSFFLSFFAVPLLLGVLRAAGIYTIVNERECHVYTFFGKVIGVVDQPGLRLLPFYLGWKAFFIHLFGACHKVDLRIDQQYLRSQAVNSEEGAPMGIGVWYEMLISDPVAYLFKNTDPRGSLAANVGSATVRCLSNLKLAEMLEDRHRMSRTVRQEVSPKSREWGFQLGSVYVRKVHFRDAGMVRQIEEKVVNRLRQVTAAILQDGANQVHLIRSAAERTAAAEFARALAMRPQIVGQVLQEIAADTEVASAMFEILENQNLLEGGAEITMIPEGVGGDLLAQLLASGDGPRPAPAGAPKAD